MKGILPTFAVMAVAFTAVGTLAVRLAPADDDATRNDAVNPSQTETYGQVANSHELENTPSAPTGQQLVRQAARNLAAHSSISARIRQRVHLFDQQLVGQGRYLQLGTGPDRLMRLELTIQAPERSTSLMQICDGRFLWIYRSLPEGDRLRRVDLRRVRRTIERTRAGHAERGPDRGESAEPARAIGPVGFDGLALGGLPRLLDALAESFRFQKPTSEMFNGEAVWAVWGDWKPSRLAQLLPEHRETLLRGDRIAPDQWPVQLPHRVRMVLGRDGLFPYRIEFYRAPENRPNAKSVANTAGNGPHKAPPAASEPMVAMDLFEVTLGAAIDPLNFAYKPGDLEVTDATDAFISRLVPPGIHPP